MHFSNIIKATTGVMAIGGVNAGIVMPQARSEAGIQSRDVKRMLSCGGCIGVVKGIVLAAQKEHDKKKGNKEPGTITGGVESVAIGYTAKQLCERTAIFEAVHINVPGAPFCLDSDDVAADGETVNGEKTSDKVAAANKDNDNVFQKAIDTAGTAIFAKIISELVSKVLTGLKSSPTASGNASPTASADSSSDSDEMSWEGH
ncbi:hypothetical protein F4775DRAFT_572021 [Biscogniauxia sp. FL1348]|nr:hypothetical protein F4775DRAFT_572021 [Biscogniauxia sp. FL1348]